MDYIRRLIEILKENDLAEIEVSTLFRKVGVSRAFGANQPVAFRERASVLEPPAAPADGEAVVKEEVDLAEIKSPMVGTFYRAASPDAEPFVEEGQSIEKGTVVCIIEAMKIMNEIESEYSGTVHKIKVADAEPVEYGQTLMMIKRR